jgi:AcrR family transcriptional regulator
MTASGNSYHHGDLKNALIQAGIEILASEGVGGLSLRSVARQAGVSHAAPYAHFADKQALIAAIATAGYRRVAERIQAAVQDHPGDPLQQLVEVAWAYWQFALSDPAHFRVTFSGVVEQEQAYPALVEAAEQGFRQVIETVAACQAAGILDPGPTDLAAVTIWSAVHGLVLLLLNGQLSHTLVDRFSRRALLLHTLRPFIRVPLPPDLDGPSSSSLSG